MTDGNSVVQNIRREKNKIILDLVGDIDLHRSVDLRASLLENLHQKPPTMIINMTEVGFMDSSGLATLVEAMQLSRRYGGVLKLFGINTRVKSVFEISRLDKIFKICQTESEALAE